MQGAFSDAADSPALQTAATMRCHGDESITTGFPSLCRLMDNRFCYIYGGNNRASNGQIEILGDTILQSFRQGGQVFSRLLLQLFGHCITKIRLAAQSAVGGGFLSNAQ